MKGDEIGWKWMKVDETESDWMKLDENGWKWMKVGESGWKWTKVDESGRKWMKVDESGWKWMKMDESGRKWMKVDDCGWKFGWKWMKVDVADIWVIWLMYDWYMTDADADASERTIVPRTVIFKPWLLDYFFIKSLWHFLIDMWTLYFSQTANCTL